MQQVLPPLSDAYAFANSGRIAEAMPIIEGHAAAGNGEALFLLGDIYWRGYGVEQDFSRGRELFFKSADTGFPIARNACTNLLASGIAGERDWTRALLRLDEEARTDGLRAQMLQVVRAMDLDAEGNPTRLPPGEKLADRPEITAYRGAFSQAECDYLRFIAEPTYEATETVLNRGDTIRAFVRTAEGSTIHWLIEDPASHAINRRVAALTQTDVARGEPMQILRYRPGQEYRPHLDFLDEPNRRVLTALIYLNDDYEGGETSFTSIGLNVKGRTGDALVFRSQGSDGNVEPLSWHAGLPVIRGTKYLASRWIRERTFRP